MGNRTIEGTSMLSAEETRLILEEIDNIVEQNNSFREKPSNIFTEILENNMDRLDALQSILEKELKTLKKPSLHLVQS